MTGAAPKSKSNKAKPPAALPSPSMTDLSFLGAPPLIPGEVATAYQQLLTAVTSVMKPANFLESIWTRDVVDLQWEIIRFRRIKADLLTDRYEQARRLPMIPLVSTQTENSNGQLANIVAININTIERIDRMVMTMEARRNAAYHEAERHRIGLGEQLRRAAEQVEDAEFREVDDALREQERAA
jgi:hypothetical protein